MDLSPELQMLLKPIPMSEAEKEFRAWIKANKDILAGRTPHEVAEVAITVGFGRDVVYKTLSTFKDAMDGSQIERRAMLEMCRFNGAMEQVQKMKAEREKVKELDLLPLWKDLHAYQTGEAA